MDKDKICYTTTNKGYSALKESLKKSGIKTTNFFFIDCVTAAIIRPKKETDCAYVSSPSALTELSLAIKERILPSQTVLIDSLSTPLVYHNDKVLSSFILDLISRVRASNANLILTISNKDENTELFKKAELLVDKTLVYA